MPVTNISNATINEISRDRENTLVTVTERRSPGNRGNERTVRLVVGPRTVILNRNNRPVPVSALRVGMIVNAQVSSAMTRSIPPQASAYFIRILSDSMKDNITTGRIVNINRDNRSFETIEGQDISTRIRFNVSDNAVIFSRRGRLMNFADLTTGMRVRVRHANFMTTSIPPQTTAFEVRVI